MKYVYHEPLEYKFKDVNGHDGKTFDTESPRTSHLIIECNDRLTVSLIQNKTEFNYYIIKGNGFFIFDNKEEQVGEGDLIVVPPGTKYTFGGKLKMLLINTPHWTKEQETIIKDEEETTN